ncbi:MAG: lysophospholipid acyltransferase family protein [Burkholderiales bacterium]|nr:lysophospholipid acyltransferase family protein [Burkholderiales bacterium]
MVRLFRLLGRLPLSLMQRVGALLGWLVWLLSPAYRLRLESQASAAGFSPQQYRPAVAAIGTMVAELPWLWLRPSNRGVLDLVRWDGVELFESALDAGQGVILALPHLGCWEMIGQSLAERYGPTRGPLVALYRPARKVWLGPLVASSRDRPGLKAVPTSVSGVRSLIRVLRSGGYTAILPDQVPPAGQGAWAPFFGRPAYTMTLLPRLAQQSGAKVLLCWCERLGVGQGYVMHFEPLDAPELHDAAATPEAATAAVNAGMERLIRQAPGQYLWSYARYKQPAQDA